MRKIIVRNAGADSWALMLRSTGEGGEEELVSVRHGELFVSPSKYSEHIRA